MFIKVGALWRKEKDDGSIYYMGRIDFPAPILLNGDLSILIRSNTSEHEKSPDLDLLIDKSRKAQATTQKPDDDIPF